jgi:hypothetical protein
MFEDVLVRWWLCSNLRTYGGFPPPTPSAEGKNEFSKCVILYAQFDIFSIYFECFRCFLDAFQLTSMTSFTKIMIKILVLFGFVVKGDYWHRKSFSLLFRTGELRKSLLIHTVYFYILRRWKAGRTEYMSLSRNLWKFVWKRDRNFLWRNLKFRFRLLTEMQ